MKTDERRRNDIRDEMLIDMARGIQALLCLERRHPPPMPAMVVVDRLQSHIEMLEGSK